MQIRGAGTIFLTFHIPCLYGPSTLAKIGLRKRWKVLLVKDMQCWSNSVPLQQQNYYNIFYWSWARLEKSRFMCIHLSKEIWAVGWCGHWTLWGFYAVAAAAVYKACKLTLCTGPLALETLQYLFHLLLIWIHEMLVSPLEAGKCVGLSGFGSRTWSARLSLCCYFALSDFFPLGSFFLFAVEDQGRDVTFI